MQRLSVEVEGLKQLAADIRRGRDTDLPKKVKAANKSIAARVVEKAMPNVPRLSGALAGSVKALATVTSASVKAGTPSRVPYAGVIHWGWRAHGITSRPFLTDAAASVEASVTADYEQALQAVIDEISAE
ncbi:MAG TPA: hypothetical protein VG899_12430 [Mycobacteriales bacterium]|nr:hypothetical protein [Mycobacteriales bacterium]